MKINTMKCVDLQDLIETNDNDGNKTNGNAKLIRKVRVGTRCVMRRRI